MFPDGLGQKMSSGGIPRYLSTHRIRNEHIQPKLNKDTQTKIHKKSVEHVTWNFAGKLNTQHRTVEASENNSAPPDLKTI